MPKVLAERLRRGLDVDDDDFDALYPSWGRWLSRIHWTPVAVARRAAELLVARPGTRVLDVGAGVGKFALIGSLVTDGVFYGIEQRKHFVQAAQAAARDLGTRSAYFLHGNMMALDWSMFDAFYLYNPFVEHLGSLEPLDGTIEVEPKFFSVYVRFVRQRLLRAVPGTRVATYHGFGARLPRTYQLEMRVRCGTAPLELWVKRREEI